jgi:hypothetical protein
VRQLAPPYLIVLALSGFILQWFPAFEFSVFPLKKKGFTGIPLSNLHLQFRGYKRKKCQQEKVVFQIARDLDRAVFLNAGETNILLAMEVSEIHGLLFFFFTIAEEPRTLVGISFSLSLWNLHRPCR